MEKLNLQLFASSYSTSNTKDEETTTTTTSTSKKGGSTSTTVTNNAAGKVDPATQQKYDQLKQGYTPSDRVNEAYKKLQDTLNSKPGDFASGYTGALNDLYSKIMGREKFTYDMNKDMLYQQYKDQFVRNGQQAMQDTLGQAASLTGGYDNSYAQSAAQQTYQGYMAQLNDKVPELYQSALNRYQQEGDELYKKFSMAQEMYDKDYNQYRDKVSDWHSDREYASSAYDSERNFDYNDFQNMLNFFQTEVWNQKHAVSESKTDSSYWEKSDSTTTSHSTKNSSTTTKTTTSGSGSGSGSGSSKKNSPKVYVSSYEEACAYLNNNGMKSKVGKVMTKREFQRGYKASEGYSSYEDYLNSMCGLK